MNWNAAVKEQLLQSQAKVDSLQRLSRSLQAEQKTEAAIHMANLEQFQKALHVGAAHSFARVLPDKTNFWAVVSTAMQLVPSFLCQLLTCAARHAAVLQSQ